MFSEDSRLILLTEPYSDRNIKKSTRTSNRYNIINHIKVKPSRRLYFYGFPTFLIISLLYVIYIYTCTRLETLGLFSKHVFTSVLPTHQILELRLSYLQTYSLYKVTWRNSGGGEIRYVYIRFIDLSKQVFNFQTTVDIMS